MTNFILPVIIAASITILTGKYAVPTLFKVAAIPGQIVPIVNGILLVIIFALSFGGLRYVFPPAKSSRTPEQAELEPLQKQRELVRTEQLRQDKAQQQLELDRLAREKAQRQLELEQLRQAQAVANQQQEAQRQEEQVRKQTAESLVRSYYEALDHRDADAAISKWFAVSNERKLRNSISNIEWFRINEVRASTISEESAEVYVDVIGKSAISNPEQWSGLIRLKWAWGEWKIEDIKGLKRVK